MRALTYAAAFARWYGAQLTVLHVVPTLDPITVGSGSFNAPVQVVLPMSREEVLGEPIGRSCAWRRIPARTSSSWVRKDAVAWG